MSKKNKHQKLKKKKKIKNRKQIHGNRHCKESTTPGLYTEHFFYWWNSSTASLTCYHCLPIICDSSILCLVLSKTADVVIHSSRQKGKIKQKKMNSSSYWYDFVFPLSEEVNIMTIGVIDPNHMATQ